MSATQMMGWTVAVLAVTSRCRVRHCTNWTASHCRVRFG